MADNVAIAFADLSGFTALTEAHGDDTGVAVALRFYEMARSVLRNGAVLVKTIGDAVMISAPDALTAVQIVLDLQAVTDSTPKFPRLRAGVHVGHVMEVDHDYLGACVNLAARIAAYAKSGELLCSSAVAAEISHVQSWRILRRGPVAFHNIHTPVEIFEVIASSHAFDSPFVDPVCRMQISPGSAVASIRISSVEYRFCSLACLRTFLRTRRTTEEATNNVG